MPRWALGLVFWLLPTVGLADEVRIAVASNFLAPLEVLAARFEAAEQIETRISAGATGHHYAQIANGAPFDVFLAADQARPARLIDEGLAVAASRFTYASGGLVLWAGPDEAMPESGLSGLTAPDVHRLAIANPRLAPYGLAARQALEATGQWSALRPQIIEGANVGQALQYLATGNASHALVAASYAHMSGQPEGEWQRVPARLHDPIDQDAVLLEQARHPQAGQAFLAFLRSSDAADVLKRFGYKSPGADS
ncbi:MAG: molybdate ABC transporter substrate-binding protein [Spiribacter salinus]|uniref:Molybdate ABC transporter substrate-binding protein n=1 Tax=Spiribacter salinus TaxID=1335746 RepID=A0A540VSV3_9GAMM|nr:MAG: molybdate ABC transporter substrate-binding protein [Spiribacter salinus]